MEPRRMAAAINLRMTVDFSVPWRTDIRFTERAVGHVNVDERCDVDVCAVSSTKLVPGHGSGRPAKSRLQPGLAAPQLGSRLVHNVQTSEAAALISASQSVHGRMSVWFPVSGAPPPYQLKPTPRTGRCGLFLRLLRHSAVRYSPA